MSIEVTFDAERAEAVVDPAYGRRVVFVVERRTVRTGKRNHWYQPQANRWVVGLRGSQTDGFSSHSTYEGACTSLLSRARRYERAYSVPRGLQAVAS